MISFRFKAGSRRSLPLCRANGDEGSFIVIVAPAKVHPGDHVGPRRYEPDMASSRGSARQGEA